MNSRMVRSVSLVSSCLVLALTVATAPAHADDPPPNGDPATTLVPLKCAALTQSAESEVSDIKLSLVEGKLNVSGSLTFAAPTDGGATTRGTPYRSAATDAAAGSDTTSLDGLRVASRPRPIQPIQPIATEKTGRVEWSIDPSTCTYTLKRAPVSNEFVTELDKAASAQQTTRNPSTQYYGYNRAGFRVVTRDPIYIPVAATTVVGFWMNDGYNAYHNWTYLDCWGANPTALNTHWYRDSCSGGGYPWQPNPYSLCYSASGSYYNYDGPPGGSPYVRTDAVQYVNFCTYGWWVTSVNFNYWHSGEGWWLLSGWLEWA